jgi:hypothetical protein
MIERPPLSLRSAGTKHAASLAAATEGAVYVEFLIAFFPILILFVGLLQLQAVFLTRLFVSRAAFAAARAAAVYVPRPDEQGKVTHEISEQARAAVDDAVMLAAAPVLLRGWLGELPYVSFPSSADSSANSERTSFGDEKASMVRARLLATYVCHMPPLDLLMCQSYQGRRVIFLSAQASFPYQRADYQYDVEKPQSAD